MGHNRGSGGSFRRSFGPGFLTDRVRSTQAGQPPFDTWPAAHCCLPGEHYTPVTVDMCNCTLYRPDLLRSVLAPATTWVHDRVKATGGPSGPELPRSVAESSFTFLERDPDDRSPIY